MLVSLGVGGRVQLESVQQGVNRLYLKDCTEEIAWSYFGMVVLATGAFLSSRDMTSLRWTFSMETEITFSVTGFTFPALVV